MTAAAAIAMPKERPILFSGPMIRAILEGRKTQTRRLVKGTALEWLAPDAFTPEYVALPGNSFSPYGFAGDRLWVRETLKCRYDDDTWVYAADGTEIALPEDDPRCAAMVGWAHHKEGDTCVSIHMPRWASRITLEVTSVRVERLHDISEQDARAEGVELGTMLPARINGEVGEVMFFDAKKAFAVLWDQINGKRAPFASSPWVWAISFRVTDVRRDR